MDLLRIESPNCEVLNLLNAGYPCSSEIMDIATRFQLKTAMTHAVRQRMSSITSLNCPDERGMEEKTLHQEPIDWRYRP